MALIWSCLSVAGCSSRIEDHARAETVPKSSTFTLRIPGEPETLDWNRAHTMVETYMLMNLMEGLVTFDANLKVVPALASSWTRSPDGRSYVFNLRRDVTWTDGVPLKAKDFVFSWKRLLSPLTAASYADFLFDVEGAEAFNKGELKDFSQVGIKAIDDHTLSVRLVKPVAHWIYIPTFWVTFPLREDVVAKHGAGWEKPGRMVSLGPFMLAAHDLDSKIVLRSNPSYYGQRGNIEEINALIIKDDSTALTLFETGKLDFLTDISTIDLKRLAGRPDLKAFPYLKTGYLGFAINKFPVSNRFVRRAIGMAIDKKRIAEILHGGQQLAYSFVPPKVMGHSNAVGLKYDPELARAELKKGGIDVTRPVSIELIMPNWDKQMILGQYIQAEIKKNLGIDLVLQPFDHKTFRAQLDIHAYPMYEASWSADYPDPDNFLSIFMSRSGNNRTTWKSDSFDQKVLEARYSTNPSKRERIYIDLQRQLLEDEAVIVPLYYEPNMALIKQRVKGLELNPLNYLLLRKVNLGS
jgi:oligopeptide transport system substrate-binding protein